MSGQPHALYRFYSDDGHLLYVGITNNPGNRFPQHEKDKPWWSEVRGISIERYDDRESVLKAETRAIQIEAPKYNKQRPPLPTRAAARDAPVPRPLVWMCDACKKAIDDNDGHLWVDLSDAEDVRQGRREWEEKHDTGRGVSLADFADLPDPTQWRRHHRGCDPAPDALAYDIGVERVRTHAHLLSWSAHLSGKTWIGCTDWFELMRVMAEIDE